MTALWEKTIPSTASIAFSSSSLAKSILSTKPSSKAFLDSHRDKDGKLSAEDAAAYDKMEADVVALGKGIERIAHGASGRH